MADRFLITKSIIDSFQYIFDCWEGCEEDAKTEFLAKLRREETKQSQGAIDGLNFEAECYRMASGMPCFPDLSIVSGVEKVAERIRGGQFQVRLSREIEVDGTTFLCYGILDVLQAGVISDIKYKEKSFGSLDLAGSYFDSPQHPMYFYLCPEAYEFRYLVSDGKDLYTETYRPGECRDIREIISEFIQGITAMGLLPLYMEHWKAR